MQAHRIGRECDYLNRASHCKTDKSELPNEFVAVMFILVTRTHTHSQRRPIVIQRFRKFDSVLAFAALHKTFRLHSIPSAPRLKDREFPEIQCNPLMHDTDT